MTTEENEQLPSGSELDEYRIERPRARWLRHHLSRARHLARATGRDQGYLARLAVREADRHVEPRSAGSNRPSVLPRRFWRKQTLAKLLHPNIVAFAATSSGSARRTW
jgi:hypothetical protein